MSDPLGSRSIDSYDITTSPSDETTNDIQDDGSIDAIRFTSSARSSEVQGDDEAGEHPPARPAAVTPPHSGRATSGMSAAGGGGGGHDGSLQSKLDQQHREYERAIRRALLENEYVKKVNSQLLTKLSAAARENEASAESIEKLKSVCASMKDLVTDLAAAKDGSDQRLREAERNYRLVAEAEEERAARSEALGVERRELDEMVTELRESLDLARKERDGARADAARIAAEKEGLVRVAAERLNDITRLQKEKIDLEEAAVAVTKEREGWERRFEGCSKELSDVASERDGLSVELDGLRTQLAKEKDESSASIAAASRRSEEYEAKYNSAAEQLKAATSERDDLEAMCSEMQKVHLAEKAELEETIDMLAKDSDEWQAKHVRCHNELQSATSERDALAAKVEDLSKSKAAAIAEKEEMARHHSEATLRLVSEKQELSGRIEMLTDAQRKSDRRSEELRVEIEAVRATLSGAEARADTSAEARDAAELEVATLRGRVEEVTAARDDEVGGLRRQLDDVGARLDDAEREKTELAASKESLAADLGSREGRIASLEAELLESRRMKEESDDVVEKLKSDHGEEIARLEVERKEAIQELEEKV